MTNPRAKNEDLTAKARIRNAAMDLYAQQGEERVSLRSVAAEAGVTLGLVQHHFKTKSGLREAVDQLIIEYFAETIASVPQSDNPREYAAARDAAVAAMLNQNPNVVNYVRRALLDPTPASTHLLDVFLELTANEVRWLRDAGFASTNRAEAEQILGLVVRQVGELMLQPLIEGVWERVAGPADGGVPRLRIEVAEA
ncbi:TetR/AcrR family transcriptional regulator [Gordonia sp. (in: high G+C Gram-positive bacteria)]|uniref:TetR/AcrR family transcriptional regulator n=1 Tax=Gordonia sp. (in: high G+C Gram-positive bacteria) TaxID=84139 RepID=UPI003F9B4C84